MTFKIEKDVPIPGSAYLRRRKYSFSEMQVGDSFLAAKKFNLNSLVAYHSKLTGFRFHYEIEHNEAGEAIGTRVWRIDGEYAPIKRKPKVTTVVEPEPVALVETVAAVEPPAVEAASKSKPKVPKVQPAAGSVRRFTGDPNKATRGRK